MKSHSRPTKSDSDVTFNWLGQLFFRTVVASFIMAEECRAAWSGDRVSRYYATDGMKWVDGIYRGHAWTSFPFHFDARGELVPKRYHGRNVTSHPS